MQEPSSSIWKSIIGNKMQQMQLSSNQKQGGKSQSQS